MRKKGVIHIGVEYYRASPVRPAAERHSDAKCGRMTRHIFDVYAKHARASRKSLRSYCDTVERVFEIFFHARDERIGITGTHFTQGSALRELRARSHASAHAYAHHERWSGVHAEFHHGIRDEFGYALVARARHQHRGASGKRTAAARHIHVHFELV